MMPFPARTNSTLSSLSSHSLEKPTRIDPPAQPTHTCPRSRAAAHVTARAYPATSPHRTAFLATRMLLVAFGLVEIALSVVALRSIDRETWMSPILSPAITSFFVSAVDIFLVVSLERRSHALTRMLYDGAIGVGFAIASGFLVSFMLGDLVRSKPTSTPATAAVGAAILFCMFSSM